MNDQGLQTGETLECPARSVRASPWPGRSLRRWLYAFLGLVSVALGFIGVFVPGLPTTVFLIVASYLFTRSCPWLEEKLVRASIFRPYLKYVDGERAMPLRARVTTIVIIWVAVGASSGIMAVRGALSPVFLATVGGLAIVGSATVATAFRGRRAGGEGRK